MHCACLLLLRACLVSSVPNKILLQLQWAVHPTDSCPSRGFVSLLPAAVPPTPQLKWLLACAGPWSLTLAQIACSCLKVWSSLRAHSVLPREHAWNCRQLNFEMSLRLLRPLTTARQTDCSYFLAHMYRSQTALTSFAIPAGCPATFCAPLLVQRSLPSTVAFLEAKLASPPLLISHVFACFLLLFVYACLRISPAPLLQLLYMYSCTADLLPQQSHHSQTHSRPFCSAKVL